MKSGRKGMDRRIDLGLEFTKRHNSTDKKVVVYESCYMNLNLVLVGLDLALSYFNSYLETLKGGLSYFYYCIFVNLHLEHLISDLE
jgi:hypothetical protein